MVAKRLPIDPLPILGGWDQKVQNQLFQNMVMLHIKLKEMTNAVTCKDIFCPFTYLDLWGGVKGQKHFFLKVVILHMK